MTRLALPALLLAFALPLAAQAPLELNPGITGSRPMGFVAYDGDVYFRALLSAAPGSAGLWRSDGTDAGTVRLSDVALLDGAVEFDGRLFFAGRTPGVTPATDALYSTDGTAVTPEAVFDPGAQVGELAASGAALYFSAIGDSNDDSELYVFDGTTTTKVEVNPNAVTGGAAGSAGSYPSEITPINDDILFWADARRYSGTTGPSVHPTLWRRSASGDLTEVLGLRPGGTSYGVAPLAVLGTDAYVATRVASGLGSTLYRVSGTTVEAVGSFSFALFPTAFGGHVYFAATDGNGAGAELWRTDGTTTELVADIVPGSFGSFPGDFYEHEGMLYFSALTPVENRVERRLWRTDGTTTERVPGIELVAGPTLRQPTPSGSAAQFASLGADLAFACTVLGIGEELCLVDGASGEVRVLDLSMGGVSAGPVGMTAAGDRLLFSAQTVHAGQDLYVYDPAAPPVSTLPVPLPGNAERLAFYENVGLFIDAGDDATGTGSFTMERFDAAPADRSGIPPEATVACRWELTASGDATFAADGSRAEVSAIAQPQCFPSDPQAAVMYWRPTVGSGAFTALTTDTGRYATQRVLRYTEPGGPGEYALATSGSVSTETPLAPEARALALAGPNPASGETRLRVDAAPGETVVVTLHDALGRRIATLHDGPAATVRVPLAGLAPGVYLARMDGADAVRITVSR